MNTYKFVVSTGQVDELGESVQTVLSFGRDIDPKEYFFKSEDDCGGEGYRVTRNKFFMEGDLLVHDHYSYAKDCDGPLETYRTRYAQASDTLGTYYLTPVWFKEDGFQRDTFAESMGY